MNTNTRYIGLGLLIGGAVAAVIMVIALAAGILPPGTRGISAAQSHTPEEVFSAPLSTVAPTSTPHIIQPPAASATPDFAPVLAAQILQTLPKYGGEWRIIIRADGDKTIFSHNAAQKSHAASIIKVPVAMLFFKAAEMNGITPEEYDNYLNTRGIGRTYTQLLKAMLVESEEAATDTLKNYIYAAGVDINATLANWGAPHTLIGERQSTAEEIAALYESLYYGRAVPPQAREIILGYLGAYTPNDETRLGVLSPLLPPDGKFYNKRGTVTDGRLIIGDSALLTWYQNGIQKVYVLVILAYNGDADTNDIKLTRGIEEIAFQFWAFAAPRQP